MLLPTEPLVPLAISNTAWYYIQHKLDGIRVTFTLEGLPRTRSGKEIPNRRIRAQLIELYSQSPWRGMQLDGELLLVRAHEYCTYNESQSMIMSKNASIPGDCQWQYVVFDMVNDSMPFENRWFSLINAAYPYTSHAGGKILLVEGYKMHGRRDIINLCELICESHEGAVVRRASARYKQGRCTTKEDIAHKYVKWMRDEARVVGTVEGVLNLDTSCQRNENLVPNNKLGALIVEHPKWGRFRIGSGFDEAERESLWRERAGLLGELVTFKYRPGHIKDAPAPAIWVGRRTKEDLSS